MRFALTTLGTGAALPARGRSPSAQVLEANGSLYLIDCGEGTQERLREGAFNFQRIRHVFISHMHGDHYLGLIGLISSMHLMGRKVPLEVHGPEELKEIIDIQLRAGRTYLRFPLAFHPLQPANGRVILQDDRLRVETLELHHRLPCAGFIFRENQAPLHLRKDRVHLVPHFQRAAVKAGEDLVVEDGSVIPNAELTTPAAPARSYAYCSDTAYARELVPFLRDIDLLYHEATFTEQLAARARDTMHSTARQAAMIAREAGVRRLLLGHFSSRYKNAEVLLAEAREVFPSAELSCDGCTYPVHSRTIV
ncbi:MAG: ribonuclease Z [Flavobacteriales bacterium]|nr:ribonuclease Z [Flavobacteriales bacterium]MCB9166594.1 ribonuclease Z [Flavobacteriales bacterium]